METDMPGVEDIIEGEKKLQVLKWWKEREKKK
jgi:hypothetical protein